MPRLKTVDFNHYHQEAIDILHMRYLMKKKKDVFFVVAFDATCNVWVVVTASRELDCSVYDWLFTGHEQY